MKITLIQPDVTDVPFPPLGLLSIGTILKVDGHSVKVLIPKVINGALIDEIIENKPDIIGFSITTPLYHYVKKIINLLKRTNTKAKLIAGGPHVTALPEHTIAGLNLNIGVIGEGEETIIEVIKNIDKNRDLESVKGIGYRIKETIIINDERELIQNIDTIPFPNRDLINYEKFLKPPGLIRGYPKMRTAHILSARGCIYNCIFCNIQLTFKNTMRKRSVENVIKEIKYLKNSYDIDSILFSDELFTSDRKWVYKFCQRYEEEAINLEWGCQTRVHPICEELLTVMKKAGCVQVEFGVESGSQDVLNSMNKALSIDHIKNAFYLAKKVGLRRLATFMIGFPGEMESDLRKTKHFAQEIKPDFASFFFTIPFPGTKLYDKAIKNKWINHDPDFKQEWFIRQSKMPIMEVNISKKKICNFRSRMQNRFLLRNYKEYLKKPAFLFSLVNSMLKNPCSMMKAFILSLKTRRLDHIIEVLAENYCTVKS